MSKLFHIAKVSAVSSCQCPAMRNGRCGLHGGLSTGPKTLEGIANESGGL